MNPATKTVAGFSDLTGQASEGIDEITKLVKDVREGRGTIGKLMTDQQLYNELQQFVAQFLKMVAVE